MKTLRMILAIAVLITGVTAAAYGAAANTSPPYVDDLSEDKIVPKNPEESPIPGEYIVVLADGTDPDSLTRSIKGEIDFVYRNAFPGFAGALTPEDLEFLAAREEVIFIEENAEVTHAETQQAGATWGLDRAEQRFLALDGDYWYYPGVDNPSGARTTRAYVLDTGILPNHNDFLNPNGGSRVATGPGETFTSINDGNGFLDCHGHGTHVSGTLAGLTWGVSKQVTIHPVRVLNCGGSGTFAGVIAGVDWVTANHVKPAVANMSIQGGLSPALNTAIDNSVAAGVFYAVAAGNFNSNACNFSPASAAQAYTVGATDQNDNRASFSNFGTCVDIFGPGVGITSAWHTSPTATAVLSGTSMASPHVAGAAALYLAEFPWATPAQVRAALDGTGTSNVVGNPGAGSPNLMLYTRSGAQLADETGSLATPSQVNVHPQGIAFYVKLDGPIEAQLDGPAAGADFDLELYKFDESLGIYLLVTAATGASADEHIIHHADPGLYYWAVINDSGSGSYTLRMSHP